MFSIRREGPETLKRRRAGFARAVALASILAAASGPGAAQSADRCQVTQANGRVIVERGDVRARVVAGVLVQNGDTIVTRRGARATIRCTDGLSMVVGPQARVGLDRLLRAADAPPAMAGVDVFRGLVGFLRPGGRRDGFAVRTPSAVAAVRSTEWTVEVADRATSAFVREGAVAIRAADRAVVLSSGDGIDVAADGAGGPVVQWGQSRIDGLSERLGSAW